MKKAELHGFALIATVSGGLEMVMHGLEAVQEVCRVPGMGDVKVHVDAAMNACLEAEKVLTKKLGESFSILVEGKDDGEGDEGRA